MTVDLAAKVAFLRSVGALDHVVETVETHLSWVFLTEQRAYKLKKPVRLPYLDFSTVERRRHSCEQELHLGRRLAHSVYEAVVPLVATSQGLAIGGPGEVVDWLVAMRRLPTDRMLPQMLARGAATFEDADAVGELLTAFYLDTRRTTWTATEYQLHMRDLVVTVAAELSQREAPRSRLDPIVDAALAAIRHEAKTLAGRLHEGRVVDAHGDLRPEHVCLESPPVVIDPLEFDDRLRMLDTASELAFFMLECERLGAAWFGERVFACYSQRAHDRVPPSVLAVYRCQHALTRALIALRRVEDARPEDLARWHTRALDYLTRAATPELTRRALPA